MKKAGSSRPPHPSFFLGCHASENRSSAERDPSDDFPEVDLWSSPLPPLELIQQEQSCAPIPVVPDEGVAVDLIHEGDEIKPWVMAQNHRPVLAERTIRVGISRANRARSMPS